MVNDWGRRGVLVRDRGGRTWWRSPGSALVAWSSTASSSSGTPRPAGCRSGASVAESPSEGLLPAPVALSTAGAGSGCCHTSPAPPGRQHPRPLRADREWGTSPVRCVPRVPRRAVSPAVEQRDGLACAEVEGVGVDCGPGPVRPARGELFPGTGGNRPGRFLTVTTAVERVLDDRADTGRGCCCRSPSVLVEQQHEGRRRRGL